MLGADRVFVGPELLQAMLQKAIQPPAGIGMVDGISEVIPGPDPRQGLPDQLPTRLVHVPASN